MPFGVTAMSASATSFSDGSILASAALAAPAYVPLSAWKVSIAAAALRTADLASVSVLLSFWPRNDGMAIPARIGMIRQTTRTSTRVKPLSSVIRVRVLRMG